MGKGEHTYYINLCYEAYFGKAMEVTADSLSEACAYAMESADDHCNWKDTLESSPHWIEFVDYGKYPVPEEFSGAATRCGGAVLIASRLRDSLRSLVEACERARGGESVIRSDIERAKAVLAKVPDRIGD
jgi:hypothetical protein